MTIDQRLALRKAGRDFLTALRNRFAILSFPVAMILFVVDGILCIILQTFLQTLNMPEMNALLITFPVFICGWCLICALAKKKDEPKKQSTTETKKGVVVELFPQDRPNSA